MRTGCSRLFLESSRNATTNAFLLVSDVQLRAGKMLQTIPCNKEPVSDITLHGWNASLSPKSMVHSSRPRVFGRRYLCRSRNFESSNSVERSHQAAPIVSTHTLYLYMQCLNVVQP